MRDRSWTMLDVIISFSMMACVYALWAVQPLPFDDWGAFTEYKPFAIPESGQMWRYAAGYFLFSTDPFSFYRPASILTALGVMGSSLYLFRSEALWFKILLTLLLALGFPYLSMIGPWNIAAASYTMSAVCFAIWCYFFIKTRESRSVSIVQAMGLCVLTFFSALWHEFFLVIFSVIVFYVFVQSAMDAGFKIQLGFKQWRKFLMAVAVLLGYVLAIKYYTNGGSEVYIDQRLNKVDVLSQGFNQEHCVRIFLGGVKENIVLVKDWLPVFFLFTFLKLNPNFKNQRLEKNCWLFFVAALGALLFTWVIYYINNGPIHWRVRWLAALVISVAFLSVPYSWIQDILKKWNLENQKMLIRQSCMIIACLWLSFNAYMAYCHTEIDVKGWLSYRQRVLDKDVSVLESVDQLPNMWGKSEDNRYRYYWATTPAQFKEVVLMKWSKDEHK